MIAAFRALLSRRFPTGSTSLTTPAPPDTPSGDAPVWVVSALVADVVRLPAGESLPREAFFEAAWDLLDDTGLSGIHEGSIDVGEAFAAGLAESSLVLDAAAAPPRDWVAGSARADAELWFASEEGARAAAARLAACAGCVVAGIRREEPRDWIADAQAAHAPLAVPGFGTVVAPWHVAQERTDGGNPDGGTTLVIDPGTGFGTGGHPTTRLCLAAIAARLPAGPAATPGLRVLDFGSGSGILAIAAALRGAADVTAVEIDERVHDAVRTNARANGVADRIALTPSLDAVAGPFDVILANIVAPVLVAAAGDLVARLRPGGTMVLSGLRDADLPAIRAAYGASGLVEASAVVEEGWSCLTLALPGPA